MKKPSLTNLALALLPLFGAASVSAATVTWVGSHEGSWNDLSNWQNLALPTALDDVQLGSFNTQITGNSRAGSVTGAGALLISAPGNSGLTLSRNSSLGGLTMDRGFFNSTATAAISSLLTWRDGSLLGPGTTRVDGSATLNFARGLFLSGGHTLVLKGSSSVQTLDSSSPNLLQILNARLVNEGSWLDQTSFNTSFTNLASELILGNFDNAGRFIKSSATVTTFQPGVLFNNTGTVNVNAGTLRLVNSFNNQGLINIASGAELDGAHASFANAGTLAGSGTVRALDTFTNTGSLAPGGLGQVGQLQLLGNLATSGGLQVDLSRSGADLLAVSGNANLGGSLNLSVPSGQRLARGSQFTVMSWSQRTAGSEFTSLDFSQASGYRFAAAYGATGLNVTVTAVPYTWTGAAAGGFWDVVNNWNDGSDGMPQAGDTVLLGGADTRIRTALTAATVTGTGRLALDGGAHLTLSDGGSLGAASLLQGQLTNNGRLVVTGPTTWISTELRGTGVTRLEGATAISGTDFDSTPSVLGSHTLELAGTTTYAGRRGLSVGDGATVINEGSWVDQAPSNVTLGSFNGGTSRFLNQGSFTKASNTRTLIGEGTSMVFNSTGTINVDAGYLRLSSSRVSSTGALNIAKGAELSMVSNDATLGGSVLNEGTLSLDGGVLTIAGDLLVQGSGVTRVKSTINNSSALRITGTVDWVESTLRGSGSTRMDGPVMLTGDRSRGVLGGHTVELAGTTTQVGTGGISVGQGARLRNLGTWLDAAAGNVGIGNFNGGATPLFENVGTFTKTSAFVTEIGNGLNFINTGTLDVQAGTLRISDNATLTAGQIKIASGAMLDLARGSIALSGTVQNAGTLALTGATVLVTDSATVQGGLTTFKGVMANTGQLRMTGNVDWFEGDLRGSGTTRMDGTVALRGAAGRQLRNGQTLELAGTTTQIDAGTLQTANGARLVNLGQWVDAANGNVHLGNFGGGAASRFDNVGRFTKTSAFVTDIGNGLVLNNTGTIDVQAGTLRISQAFNNQGLLNVAAGAEVASTVVDFANAGTLTGDGTVRTVNAFSSLGNTGTLAAGGLNDAGTLSLLGGLTQQAGGTFLVDLASTAAGGFDVLTVSGSASLGGTLAVNLLAGAHFNVGDSFPVMTWNKRLNNSQFASLDLSQAGGYGFTTEYGANELTLRVMTAPVPVPEPGTYALMLAGLGLIGLTRRRKFPGSN